MNKTPYEKLCTELIGGLPDNRRGATASNQPTASLLAKRMGMRPATVLRWPLIPGTNIRIIPPGSAGIIEKLSNGAVTAEEIRDFAKRQESGKAA